MIAVRQATGLMKRGHGVNNQRVIPTINQVADFTTGWLIWKPECLQWRLPADILPHVKFVWCTGSRTLTTATSGSQPDPIVLTCHLLPGRRQTAASCRLRFRCRLAQVVDGGSRPNDRLWLIYHHAARWRSVFPRVSGLCLSSCWPRPFGRLRLATSGEWSAFAISQISWDTGTNDANCMTGWGSFLFFCSPSLFATALYQWCLPKWSSGEHQH